MTLEYEQEERINSIRGGLAGLAEEGLKSGKSLDEIQNDLKRVSSGIKEDFVRRGLKNLTLVDHLLMCSTPPKAIWNDPRGCELDYMSDQQVREYFLDLEKNKAAAISMGWYSDQKWTERVIEQDRAYLISKGRTI